MYIVSYEKEVRYLYDLKPTDGHKSFYGMAKVKDCEETHFLYSYGLMVAGIEDGLLHRHWGGYSATTMRHINSFCETYGASKINKKKWLEMPVEVRPRLERIENNDH